MLVRRLLPIACFALLLGSCGGADEPEHAGGARTQATRPPDGERNPLELPASVPLKATGPADPAHTKVIRAWSDALRAGDVAAASAVWAVPSKVQNGTPVLKLPDRAAVRLFNGSLPCGSIVIAAGGATNGFTIAEVHLTQRKGARCDAEPGATARTAIRVRGGRIVEWYRLPDDPDAPGLQPLPQDDPEASEV